MESARGASTRFRAIFRDYGQRIVFPFGGIFRHGDTSINICAAGSGDHVTLDLPRPYANIHAAAYARVPSRTRSVMHLPSTRLRCFRRESSSSYPADRCPFVAREREREREALEDSETWFLIRPFRKITAIDEERGSANVDNGITRDARAEDTRLGLFSLAK